LSARHWEQHWRHWQCPELSVGDRQCLWFWPPCLLPLAPASASCGAARYWSPHHSQCGLTFCLATKKTATPLEGDSQVQINGPFTMAPFRERYSAVMSAASMTAPQRTSSAWKNVSISAAELWPILRPCRAIRLRRSSSADANANASLST
jgi:hypothetical protein